MDGSVKNPYDCTNIPRRHAWDEGYGHGFAAGAAQERERCLKACDDFDSADDAAAAIRASGGKGKS